MNRKECTKTGNRKPEIAIGKSKIHENARNAHPKLELDTVADHTNFPVKIRFLPTIPVKSGGGRRRHTAAGGGDS